MSNEAWQYKAITLILISVCEFCSPVNELQWAFDRTPYHVGAAADILDV